MINSLYDKKKRSSVVHTNLSLTTTREMANKFEWIEMMAPLF